MNHISTGRALSPRGELLPPRHRRHQRRWRWRWSQWRWLRGQFPVPAGCRNRDFCPPKLVFDGGGAAELFMDGRDSFRVFVSGGFYRRKDDVRGWTRGPHHTLVRLEGARHQVVRLPPGPPLSLLWTLSCVRKNRNFGLRFVQFWEYFLCNFSETQKQQKTGTSTVASCQLVSSKKCIKMPQSVNKTQNNWCKNKHGASKIIDTFATYHLPSLYPQN
jgi:hypothetical protein